MSNDAGPPVASAFPVPRNSPVPMVPPMAIIWTWRAERARRRRSSLTTGPWSECVPSVVSKGAFSASWAAISVAVAMVDPALFFHGDGDHVFCVCARAWKLLYRHALVVVLIADSGLVNKCRLSLAKSAWRSLSDEATVR